MFAFQALRVEVELCWEVAVSFFFITDRTLSAHRCQVGTPDFLPFRVKLCGVVYIQGLVHGSKSLDLGV